MNTLTTTQQPPKTATA